MRAIPLALVWLLCFKAIPLKAKDIAKCDNALTLCGEVVQEQDVSIAALKLQVSTLEDRLASSQNGPILPEWLIFVAGITLGGAITFTLHH